MTEIPIQGLLLEAIAIIDGRRLPYAIMGGFAVGVWGVPRPTYDADIAVAAGDDELTSLLVALEAAGFDVPEEYRKGFHDRVGGMEKVKVTRFVAPGVWEIDLFLARGPFLESALVRRRTCALAGRSVQVMAPEDVILLKLIAHRRKDQADVEEILKVTPDVDRAYLRSWAARLGVSERLEAFLA